MEKREGELKVKLITNPLYVGNLAMYLMNFVDKVPAMGVSYESLKAYFEMSVQNGQGRSEFWVAFYDDQPTAFAHWYVMSLPNIGKVCCDYIMSWNRKKGPIEKLVEKFIEFGIKKRSPIYSGFTANEAIFRVFRKAAHSHGIKLENTGIINCVGRK